MFSKLNPGSIIQGHFQSLHKYGEEKIDGWELGLHVGLPVALGIAASFGCLSSPNKDDIVVIATVLSIFAALLFSLLVLLLDRSETRLRIAASENNVRSTIIAELHENVSYAIFVALLDLVVLVFKSFNVASLDKFEKFEAIRKVHHELTGWGLAWERVLDSAVFLLGSSFVLTIFMILKRMHNLFAHDIEVPKTREG